MQRQGPLRFSFARFSVFSSSAVASAENCRRRHSCDSALSNFPTLTVGVKPNPHLCWRCLQIPVCDGAHSRKRNRLAASVTRASAAIGVLYARCCLLRGVRKSSVVGLKRSLSLIAFQGATVNTGCSPAI